MTNSFNETRFPGILATLFLALVGSTPLNATVFTVSLPTNTTSITSISLYRCHFNFYGNEYVFGESILAASQQAAEQELVPPMLEFLNELATTEEIMDAPPTITCIGERSFSAVSSTHLSIALTASRDSQIGVSGTAVGSQPTPVPSPKLEPME